MSGTLALTCAARGERSYVPSLRYEGLLRASRPRIEDGVAHVVVAHLGPGIIGGDRYATRVRVEEGASLVLTGQMATPVYARGGPSAMDAAWTAASGASLVVRGEPLMLDRDARHEVRTEIDVAGGGSAVTTEIVTVGAGACVRLRTLARIDGRLVARDAWDLREHDAAIATLLFVCGDPARREAFAHEARRAIEATAGVPAGVGATSGAVLVRALSPRVWPLARLLERLVTIRTPSRTLVPSCG